MVLLVFMCVEHSIVTTNSDIQNSYGSVIYQYMGIILYQVSAILGCNIGNLTGLCRKSARSMESPTSVFMHLR